MSRDDFPEPQTGFVVTHFLVVSDQDRSRDYYQSVFGAEVVQERDPVILKLANSWLILNVGGGPTDDKPTVTLTTPQDPIRRARLSTSGWPTSLPLTRSGQRAALSSSPSPSSIAPKSARTSGTLTAT